MQATARSLANISIFASVGKPHGNAATGARLIMTIGSRMHANTADPIIGRIARTVMTWARQFSNRQSPPRRSVRCLGSASEGDKSFDIDRYPLVVMVVGDASMTFANAGVRAVERRSRIRCEVIFAFFPFVSPIYMSGENR